MFDDGWQALELDEELYPRDAVYGAAYVFIERCYLHLERAADKRVRVRLRPKAGAAALDWAGEFQNEALAQAYRRRLAAEHHVLIEVITARAIAGAAGPPGLDDLLAMEIGDETAFEDPLGIAMSWEEKYTKKKAAKAEAAEPADPGPPEVELKAPPPAEPEKKDG
jgi:His-Xaa-Ser system protein HxsD